MIEWLWKYIYFVNLRKMVHTATKLSKYDLIYGNIILYLATADKLISSPLPPDPEDFFHPYLHQSGSWFLSPLP